LAEALGRLGQSASISSIVTLTDALPSPRSIAVVSLQKTALSIAAKPEVIERPRTTTLVDVEARRPVGRAVG
jgi:hypothetical protein